MRRFGATLLMLTSLALSARALAAPAACTVDELNRFVAAAQTLAKAAVTDGDRLIHCPLLKDRVVQWQAFLLAGTGQKAASLRLDDPAPGKLLGMSRDAVLARARSGNFRDLRTRIDDQEPGFATAPDAQLVLARVLTRKGNFAAGREAFLAYLRLKPDDDDVEAEYLYSFIWEGNYTEAESRFAAIARYPMQPALAQAVGRGKTLIAQHPAPPGSTQRQARTAAGTYHAALGAFHISHLYQRRTAEASYQNLLDLRLAAHTIDVDSIDRFKTQSTEVVAGGRGTVGGSLLLKGHAGYYSAGSDHYFGDAGVGLAILPDLVVETGAYRQPLTLLMPLVEAEQDLMRDAIYYGARYGRYVELHLEIQKEKDFASHENHTLIGRVPVHQGDGGNNEVWLRLPLSLEVFPRPSPNYDAPSRTMSLGLGGEVQRDFASRWKVAFQLDYNLAFVTARAAGTATKRAGYVAAELSAAVPLDESWKLTAEGRYFKADEQDQLVTKNRLSGLAFGLSFADASAAR